MTWPAVTAIPRLSSDTAPPKVCEPAGLVTLAWRMMPKLVACPWEARLTEPAPLAETGLAITIASLAPVPVSMLRLWAAAPFVTAERFTPALPITTRSVPVLPTTEMPANVFKVLRSTEIVSVAGSIVTPVIGAAKESVPVLAAVIESTRVFEAKVVLRSVIAVPAESSVSTSWLATRLTTMSSAASIARASSAPKPPRLAKDRPLRTASNPA